MGVRLEWVVYDYDPLGLDSLVLYDHDSADVLLGIGYVRPVWVVLYGRVCQSRCVSPGLDRVLGDSEQDRVGVECWGLEEVLLRVCCLGNDSMGFGVRVARRRQGAL